MFDDRTILTGLLRAYIEGDTLARRALLDFLEENDDERREMVEAEHIDWNRVARQLIKSLPTWTTPKLANIRWQIDCARYGSTTTPEVAKAVQTARRKWLAKLFPEIELE